jgi:hypothetical protein
MCPKCLGNYDVHPDGGNFEVVWDRSINPAWVPQPDTDTVNEVTYYAPRELRLPSNYVERKFSFS